MITLVLQTAAVLLHLVFAVLALLIIQDTRAAEANARAGWRMTGVILSIYSVNLFLHNLGAILAFSGGAESRAYAAYMTWTPIANHSRTFILFSLYLCLLGLVLGKPWFDRLSTSAALAFTALLLGGFYGYLEGPLQIAVHYPRTVLFDIIGFVFLGGLLLVALSKNLLDRYLWTIIALFGFKSLISSLFLAAMSWFDAPGTWIPPLWQVHGSRLIIISLIVAIAGRRLTIQRRGQTAAPLLIPARRQGFGMR